MVALFRLFNFQLVNCRCVTARVIPARRLAAMMALAFAAVTTSPAWAQDKAIPPAGKSDAGPRIQSTRQQAKGKCHSESRREIAHRIGLELRYSGSASPGLWPGRRWTYRDFERQGTAMRSRINGTRGDLLHFGARL